MTTAPYFDLTNDGLDESSIMGVWSWIRPMSSRTPPSPPVTPPRQPQLSKDTRRKDLNPQDTRASNGRATSRELTNENAPNTPPPDLEIPASQTVLLLNAVRTPYTLTPDYPLPILQNDDEVLIKTQVIGLNPIDWKAPDFNFGIPSLPHICGRDMVGIVVRGPKNPSSRLKTGDVVIATSTDYRNTRKSTFQSYVLASTSNISILPASISPTTGAALGVAYVAATLALGICLGISFSSSETARGPDLLSIISEIPDSELPADVLKECRNSATTARKGILLQEEEEDEVQGKVEVDGKGDWIAIWGSSTTGFIISQLAKLAGLRVLLVVDLRKHGERLHKHGADMLVDAHDPERAVAVIRAVTGGALRYGVDTVGKETAGFLGDALANNRKAEGLGAAHLVGLTGLPTESKPGVVYHTVPIKLFHEVKAIGEGLMRWLEVLLAERLLKPPGVEVVDGGLESVNGALDRMRRGEIRGKRMVVRFE